MVAKELKVSQRHVQRPWAEYPKTDKAHVQGRAGRPKKPPPSDAEADLVLDTHRRWPDGVQLTVRRPRRAGCDIRPRIRDIEVPRYGHRVSGKVEAARGARYERTCSTAVRHTYWRVMKDPRTRGLNLTTYLDDASRCVTGAEPFGEATSENAVTALRRAVGRFGAPATILSDNGSCFVGSGRRKKPSGSWTPTLFEAELLSLDIGLINSRRYRSQTNGKPGGSTGAKARYGAMPARTTISNITTPTGCAGRRT